MQLKSSRRCGIVEQSNSKVLFSQNVTSPYFITQICGCFTKCYTTISNYSEPCSSAKSVRRFNGLLYIQNLAGGRPTTVNNSGGKRGSTKLCQQLSPNILRSETHNSRGVRLGRAVLHRLYNLPLMSTPHIKLIHGLVVVVVWSLRLAQFGSFISCCTFCFGSLLHHPHNLSVAQSLLLVISIHPNHFSFHCHQSCQHSATG